jgi:5-methylcytosine-specific restriction enzyme A
MKKDRKEPIWCKMYRDEVLKPQQKKRITEQLGRTRESQEGFYNSPAWKKIRDQRRRENPICQECERKGIIRPMNVVDHIIPIDEDPALALYYDNTQSLCTGCHVRKTNNDKKKKAKRIRIEKGRKIMEKYFNSTMVRLLAVRRLKKIIWF